MRRFQIAALSSAGRARAEQIAARTARGRQVVEEVLEQVALLTGIAPAAITAECRQVHLVEARDLVVYEAHLRGVCLHVIAGALGRDWSTVRAALRCEAARRDEASQ